LLKGAAVKITGMSVANDEDEEVPEDVFDDEE
jgi:hypothetical protein